MSEKTLVGFGFGPIQSGLFVYEAFQSRNFDRLIIAEVLPDLVDAIRASKGEYAINVATRTGIEYHTVEGVEVYNPSSPIDREALIEGVSIATEIVTALPNSACFGSGEPGDVIDILHHGLLRKAEKSGPSVVIYTAENNPFAAESLEKRLTAMSTPMKKTQCLNTVIGKMSGIVTNNVRIKEENLKPLTNKILKAVLVEKFNKILVSKIHLPGFVRGLDKFEEKDDLIPFEKAKFHGHNAVHALLGYLLREKGHEFMADARNHYELMSLAHDAFIYESGMALCEKYGTIDRLFTHSGFANYVESLMARIVNPYLRDTVTRVTRDPRRKLGWNDRLVGTMRMVMEAGIKPERFSIGTAAALRYLQKEDNRSGKVLLSEIWNAGSAPSSDIEAILELVLSNC